VFILGLTNDQLTKIKRVRCHDDFEKRDYHKGIKSSIGGGFGYASSLKALKMTDWNVEEAIELLRDTSEFGKTRIC